MTTRAFGADRGLQVSAPESVLTLFDCRDPYVEQSGRARDADVARTGDHQYIPGAADERAQREKHGFLATHSHHDGFRRDVDVLVLAQRAGDEVADPARCRPVLE